MNEANKRVLRALAGAHGDMSTADIARECFDGKVPSPIGSAYQVLRRLTAAGLAELSGRTPHRGAGGGPVFTWKITPAGRARLAEQEVPGARLA